MVLLFQRAPLPGLGLGHQTPAFGGNKEPLARSEGAGHRAGDLANVGTFGLQCRNSGFLSQSLLLGAFLSPVRHALGNSVLVQRSGAAALALGACRVLRSVLFQLLDGTVPNASHVPLYTCRRAHLWRSQTP